MAVLISQSHTMGVPKNFKERIGTLYFVARGTTPNTAAYVVSIVPGIKFHTIFYPSFAAVTHISIIKDNYFIATMGGSAKVYVIIFEPPKLNCITYN